MKKGINLTILAAIAVLSSFCVSRAADEFSANAFSGPDQLLNEEEAALYLVYRDKIPLATLMKPGQLTLRPKEIAVRMEDRLDDIRSKTGHGSPWKGQEIDSAFSAEGEQGPKHESHESWKRIEGITEAKKISPLGGDGSLGPFRIRKTTDDLPKDLSDAKGATVGFANNRLTDEGFLWNSQGAIDYPITVVMQGGAGKSTELEIGPSVDWQIAESGDGIGTEELNLSMPLTALISPGRRKMTGTYEENLAAASNTIFSRLWIVQARPYFQTDFSGDHEIIGLEASGEFVGGLPGTSLYIGGFQNLGDSGLQYQVRLIPKLNYSSTQKAGEHTQRVEGDDWLRIGGVGSFDLRFGGKSFNPLDLGVSCEMSSALQGSGGFSDLIGAHVTWWLSENAGLTLEYAKGTTPVAEEDVDLLTLGFEFKY